MIGDRNEEAAGQADSIINQTMRTILKVAFTLQSRAQLFAKGVEHVLNELSVI